MSDNCPFFKVGQRVRAKVPSTLKHRRGTITRIARTTHRQGSPWLIVVDRDRTSSTYRFLCYRDGFSIWEPIPEVDLTLDDTAQLLADAVKKGDTNAALLLADRVMELCGGTPRNPSEETKHE